MMEQAGYALLVPLLNRSAKTTDSPKIADKVCSNPRGFWVSFLGSGRGITRA